MVAGASTYYLGQYLDTGNPHFGSGLDGFLGDLLYVVMPFYAFLAVMYMRVRIGRAEPKLTLLSLNGEESYHIAFRGLSQLWPTVLLSVTLFVVAF
jgi:hypothetical protein